MTKPTSTGSIQNCVTSGARLLVLFALASALTACAGFSAASLNPLGWFSDDEVDPPTPLVNILAEAALIASVEREYRKRAGRQLHRDNPRR